MIRQTILEVRPITIDDQEAVFVPLVGRHGRDLEMLLDKAVWECIKTPSGHACWATLMASGSLRVDHPEHGALARWILRAPERARVGYLNGNWLDLRRSNVVLAKDAPPESRPRIPPEQAERNTKRAQQVQQVQQRRLTRLLAEAEKLKAQLPNPPMSGVRKQRQQRRASMWVRFTKEQRWAGA